MIEQAVARRVLEAALTTGGDFSELYVEDKESNRIAMIDGAVESATSSHSRGAGVRILRGTRSVYAYSADTREEALLATAKAAASALDGVGEGQVLRFAATDYRTDPRIPFSSVNNAMRVELLKRGGQAAKAYSPEITQVTASLIDMDQRVLVCNSEGVWAEDRRPRTRLAVEAVAMAGGEAQTGHRAPGLGMGFEAFEQIDIEGEAQRAAQIAVTMLHAPECPAGFVPVVIDGGFGGVIFHEACGHSLEATAVAKGNSEFCGKLGQKIAADCVSAVDDGTIAGAWGSIGMDDEGTPSRRRVLIENGILKSYMIDLLGSRLMGMPVTASSRRQDYSFAPTSRMTNTFIAPGTDDEEEMIRTMGNGLFAKSMGGGSVNPVTGEFNFAVDEGYWVKDGRIVTPVRGATLVGKGSEILLRIDRVGHHMWMGQGMCGSVSGSIPTNVGQPRIRVSGVTVGGKGGAI